jgi:hypothetical protein
MRASFIYFGLILGMGLSGITSTPNAHASGDYIDFKISVYKDKNCKGKPWGNIDIDTKPGFCSSYEYADSKGVITKGGNGSFRCYKDKVVYNKYPFSATCSPDSDHYTPDYSVPATGKRCFEAVSHEGPVYEYLKGYKYPGNVECKKMVKK